MKESLNKKTVSVLNLQPMTRGGVLWKKNVKNGLSLQKTFQGDVSF